ncbi:MAG: hypothetical protein ABSB01_01145 [Streptosporangiaceae bacterium]|jgi:predicted ATPase
MTNSSSLNTDQRVKRWIHLTSSTGSFQLYSIRIADSNVFAPQLIEFHRATAFIGLHGSGKSLLLRMIEAAFGYTSPSYVPPFFIGQSSPVFQIPTVEGIMDVSLRTPAGIISHTVDLSQPAERRAEIWEQDVRESFAAWYTDPYGALSWLSHMYDNYDFGSECGGSEIERHIEGPELNEVRNILGRSYKRITVRSAFIDDGAGDDLHLPFFSAVLGSKTFDNTTMSQGELWVHYVSWFLEHEVSKGELALLDEPEAFLAARGRRPFIDYVAHQALRRDLQVIIGTHSPEVLSRFPLANIRMCIPGGSGIQVLTPTSRFQIRECIGIETPLRGLVLVEDELAQQLLNGIFARYDTALASEVEVIPVGGASEVANGLRILQSANRLMCFGILDADQRQTAADWSDASRGSVLFLPGDRSPEEEVLTSAIKESRWLAEMIDTSTDDILIAISSCQDLDHQYRVNRVARQLGYSESALISMLVLAWLRQPEIAQEAEQLARKIRSGLRNDTVD